jgi:hypothetical protein
MRINDYIKINVNDPENEPLLKVDYYSLLPMFDKYYTRVFQGDVLFIDFPYIDKQYVELSRKYYMEGVADLTVLTMNTIYDIAIDRKEHRFKKIRPVRIDTGQTIIISGPARGGKSSLALWLAYALYGDWDVAIAHIVIDPLQLDDLVGAMKTYGIDKIPMIIIDDAGIGFGKQVGKIDRLRLQKMHLYAQTWAMIFNNVALTTTDESRVSGAVMNAIPFSYSITIEPIESTTTTSEAHVYKNIRDKITKKLLKKKHELRDYNSIRIGLMLKKKLIRDFAHVVYTPRLIPDEAYVKYKQLMKDYLEVISKYEAFSFLPSNSRYVNYPALTDGASPPRGEDFLLLPGNLLYTPFEKGMYSRGFLSTGSKGSPDPARRIFREAL